MRDTNRQTTNTPDHARTSGAGTPDLLLVIPWLGTALLWFWVGEAPVIRAGDYMFVVVTGTVLSTSLAVAADNGPWLSTLAMYVIVYPSYMAGRGKLLSSLFGMGVFLFSAVYIYLLYTLQI